MKVKAAPYPLPIKLQSSAFIPYRIRKTRKKRSGKLIVEMEYFLQRRDKDAPVEPKHFGFFGGGIERGESPEEALVREVKEELDIRVKKFWLFGRYERIAKVFWVYALEVGPKFHKEVTILEGEYGKFLTLHEAIVEGTLTPLSQVILKELNDFLTINRQT